MEEDILKLNERVEKLEKILSERIIYQCPLCKQVSDPKYECCLGEECYSLRNEGYQTLSGYVNMNIRCGDCFENEERVCKCCNKLYCCDDEHKYITVCYYCGDMFCKEHMTEIDDYKWYCEKHVQLHTPSRYQGWYD